MFYFHEFHFLSVGYSIRDVLQNTSSFEIPEVELEWFCLGGVQRVFGWWWWWWGH